MLSAAAMNLVKLSGVSSNCVARETLFESVRVTWTPGPAAAGAPFVRNAAVSNAPAALRWFAWLAALRELEHAARTAEAAIAETTPHQNLVGFNMPNPLVVGVREERTPCADDL